MTKPENWQLKGIEDLEPAAWDALQYPGNACVVAGPGAGKTEFLAQKAAFLLESGLCRAPYKILAISFKKDAAENLDERVKKRCISEQGCRFDSMTFDAFTKSLVDRFRLALPEEWRIPVKYEITNFYDRQYQEFLDWMRDKNPNHQDDIAAIRVVDFKNIILATHKIIDENITTINGYLSQAWFKSNLKNNAIDFMLINRLAEFLVRRNISLHRAINRTYKFIFIDEFQDTTYSQYDFLFSLFVQSLCSITTVGDNKQRIMLWAGARPDAFERFISDFRAEKFSLEMNYRSSPGLVQIHHFLAQSLEPGCARTRSGALQKINEDFAQIWNFTNPRVEYGYIAEWIASDLKARKLQPKDYAILVRQKPDDVYQSLSDAFGQYDLLFRNEAQKVGKLSIQDIMSDDIFIFISALFRLTIHDRAPLAWTIASDYIQFFLGKDSRTALSLNSDGYLSFLLKNKLRPKLQSYDNCEKTINDLLDIVIESISLITFKGVFPQYSSGESLDIFFEALREYFLLCARKEKTWGNFIDMVDGVHQIPLLTVHKSKGLEYDTVIFVGLDDSSWWSYSQKNPEGKSTFFVAFSRAKQRVIFTYSKGEYGRKKVSELYGLLTSGGVPEKTI